MQTFYDVLAGALPDKFDQRIKKKGWGGHQSEIWKWLQRGNIFMDMQGNKSLKTSKGMSASEKILLARKGAREFWGAGERWCRFSRPGAVAAVVEKCVSRAEKGEKGDRRSIGSLRGPGFLGINLPCRLEEKDFLEKNLLGMKKALRQKFGHCTVCLSTVGPKRKGHHCFGGYGRGR